MLCMPPPIGKHVVFDMFVALSPSPQEIPGLMLVTEELPLPLMKVSGLQRGLKGSCLRRPLLPPYHCGSKRYCSLLETSAAQSRAGSLETLAHRVYQVLGLLYLPQGFISY